MIYGLAPASTSPPCDYWGDSDDAAAFRVWAGAAMSDGTIVHQHYHATERLIEVTEQAEIELVTTLRDPYDQFVSLYFYVQRFRQAFIAARDPAANLIDKDIRDDTVLSFLATSYGRYLEQGLGWIESRRSSIVRYEDLIARPEETILTLTNRIAPVGHAAVRRSLDAASVDRMRAESPELRLHIRSATVGDWRNHLAATHLEAMLEHEELISELGYRVRSPGDLSS